MTLQDRLRLATNGVMSQIGGMVWSWRVHPDTITITGFAMVAVAACFVTLGQLQVAGLILIVSLPLDALDGAVARAMNQPNRKFGGVLDSTLDRYADGLLLGGVMLYYSGLGQREMAAVSLVALLGAFTTSYIRSRAGVEGQEIKIGPLDRLARVVILLVGLLLPMVLWLAVVVIAVLGNVTTFRRLKYAYQHME